VEVGKTNLKDEDVVANTMTIKNKLSKHRIIYRILSRIKRSIIRSSNHKKNGYSYWIKNKEADLWKQLDSNAQAPLISVIVPTFNTPDKYLNPLIDSLFSQTYKNWQLCIADASTDIVRQSAIEAISKSDERIKYHYNKGLHISDNTNQALKLATGKFVGLLDHDDILSPYALEEVAAVINKHHDVDIIYSDEDKLSDDGKERLLPFFKPDWSPDLLLGVNYITHFLVIRKTFLDKVGGPRSRYDGAQDYDLLLRVTEKTDKIIHIPKILYHWRLAEGSTAKTVGEKNYADTAGQRALADAVKRRGIKAKVVEIPERPTNYRLKFTLPEKQPKASIIIPFKDRADLLKQCVGSILDKTTYKNYELILISNNSTETSAHDYLQELKKEKRCKIYHWDNPFNYSKINNFGRTKATGEYLVLLNNDTKVITPEWLEELIGAASQPGVGAVGPLLYYPNKTIQHAGVVLGMTGMAGHVFRHRLPTDWTDFGLPAWPRNYLAVTAACLAIQAKKYDEAGGLDEIFTVAGNDVALGIKLYEAGYRNVYWPFAELIHYENVSVGSYQNVPQLDYDHSLTYYRPYLDNGDPYFSPNLDLMNEQIGLKETA
jgi:glycosyltransferase involved in cell wall biosynthesis